MGLCEILEMAINCMLIVYYTCFDIVISYFVHHYVNISHEPQEAVMSYLVHSWLMVCICAGLFLFRTCYVVSYCVHDYVAKSFCVLCSCIVYVVNKLSLICMVGGA